MGHVRLCTAIQNILQTFNSTIVGSKKVLYENLLLFERGALMPTNLCTARRNRDILRNPSLL